MMHKTLTTIFASVAAAMLLASAPASATVYKFTFESFDSQLTATGTMTVDAAGEVTGMTGLISGLVDQTIGSVTPNANFPGAAYSPDGSFIYNNLYYTSGMAFDIDGVLFSISGNLVHLAGSGDSVGGETKVRGESIAPHPPQLLKGRAAA